MTILPVLLAGGSGTRLWPLSRQQYPKQFLKLFGEETLLQATAARVAAIPRSMPPLVICGDRHRFVAAEQLLAGGVTGATIMLEPEGRNTLPAIAVATHYAAGAYGAETLLLVTPADQIVGQVTPFVAAVQAGTAVAERGKIVTFGVHPTRAETGFGYIGASTPIAAGAFLIDRFVEKPDRQTAEKLLAADGYYWNGGMFLFQAGAFLKELERLEPETYAAAHDALARGTKDLDFIRLDAKAFESAHADSIDYAIMEKTALGALVPLDAGWDDVGSWRVLDAFPKDHDGNAAVGDVLFESASGNLVYADSRLVALAGVTGQIVVETSDAVLVTTREHAQSVKNVVRRLVTANRSEAQCHKTVYRPWGSYETLALGPRFQVKRLVVKPLQKLSLQMHYHRAEHWVVVKGTARVTIDDHVSLLREDESVYVPLGARHRLENPGRIPLEIIEVQSGAYLQEDDIVRFDDVYGRSERNS